MCEFDERCAGGHGTDTVLADTLERIERYGWALVGVLGVPGASPDFAYTVGLTALGYPELAMFGLPAEVSAPWLNAAADRVIRRGAIQHGAKLVAGGVVGSGSGPGVVAVRMAHGANLTVAEELYPTDPIASIQLVWRDLAGRLPWQAGYDSRRCRQPLYGAAPGALTGPVVLAPARQQGRHDHRHRRRRAS